MNDEEHTLEDFGEGVIALAAYQPREDLFVRQLKSIQGQTYSKFICLISSDGGLAETRRMVSTAVGDDPRFEVIGFESRLGFLANFERVLSSVLDDAIWVALADQDDYWYPEKLQAMLPLLESFSMVAAQARVVKTPSNIVLAASTERKNVPLGDLLTQNQVTGSLSLFRKELLTVGLPIPKLNTVAAVHDHWLAVCASATGGLKIVDDVVQDYVQHEQNVLGEVEHKVNLFRSVGRVVELSRKYEGRTNIAAVLKTAYKLSFGWRRLMSDELKRRVGCSSSADFSQIRFASGRSWLRDWRELVGGVASGNVSSSCLVEFLAGAPYDLVVRFRRSGK